MKLQGIVTDKLIGIYRSCYGVDDLEINRRATHIERTIGLKLIENSTNITHYVHGEIAAAINRDIVGWWIRGLAGKAWATILGK